jgi:hypothetical protein
MARVFINPGHGKHKGDFDPGAVGPTGRMEADHTLMIGDALALFLKEAGHTVLLFQDGDPKLYPISNASNQWKAEYFVSIHRNAAAAANAAGIETYSLTGTGKGREMAVAVQASLAKAFPDSPNRGAKTANFHVLRETNCPAILAEVGFISNPREELWFESNAVVVMAARAVAGGLIKVIGGKKGSDQVKALVLYSGDGDLPSAQILAWKKGAYLAPVASYKADPVSAGVIYVVGGSYAPEGAVLLSGANRTETAEAVVRELAKN